MRRDLGAFSRPGQRDRGVPRTRGSLPNIPWDWMLLSIIGRTCPSIPSLHTQDEVDDLADELGYEKPYDWDEVSVTNRLDLLATHLIEESRDGGRAQHSEFVLSPWQWMARTKREIPMNHEQLQAVLAHVRWACLYRGSTHENDTPALVGRSMDLRQRRDEQARRLVRA